MCQPYPGPRCYSHTGRALKVAQKRWVAAKADHQRNPSPETEKALTDASMDRYEAQLEYYGTPRGAQQLDLRIKQQRDRGFRTEELEELQSKARGRRKERESAAAKMKAAQAAMSKTGSLKSLRTSQLKSGDVLASTGATIVRIYADSQTRRGYRTVELRSPDGSMRKSEWNISTQVQIGMTP